MLEIQNQEIVNSLMQAVKEKSASFIYNFNTEANRYQYTEDVLGTINRILKEHPCISVTENGNEFMISDPKLVHNPDKSNENLIVFSLEGTLINGTNISSDIFDLKIN